MIHPTVLNLTLGSPPSVTNIARFAVDVVVPLTQPLNEKEWDLLDEAVTALIESFKVEGGTEAKIVICMSITGIRSNSS